MKMSKQKIDDPSIRKAIEDQIKALPVADMRASLVELLSHKREDSFVICVTLMQRAPSVADMLLGGVAENEPEFHLKLEARLALATGNTLPAKEFTHPMSELPIIREFLAKHGYLLRVFESFESHKMKEIEKVRAVLVTPFVDLLAGAEALPTSAADNIKARNSRKPRKRASDS